MSKELYEEALADVKKLREVAEDSAKKALLEAVTPRIRDLIENQLMGLNPEVEDNDDLLLDEVPHEEEAPLSPVPQVGDSAAAAAISMPDAEGKVTLDLDALRDATSGDYAVDQDTLQKLGALSDASDDEEDVSHLDHVVESLAHRASKFSSASQKLRATPGYSDSLDTIISEVEDTYSKLQAEEMHAVKRQKLEETLENTYKSLREISEQTMNRKNRLAEADVTLKLTGMPDDVDLDSVGVDLITGGEDDSSEEKPEGEEASAGEDEDLDLDSLDLGDEGESEEASTSGEDEEEKKPEDDTVVEIDEGMLRREIKRMRALREANETKPNSWGHGAGDVSHDGEKWDDEGDPLDLELTTEAAEGGEDAILTMDEAQDDEDMAGVPDEAQTNKQGRQPAMESIRRRLSFERRLQAEAKKKGAAIRKKKNEAHKKAASAKKVSERLAAKKDMKKLSEAFDYYRGKYEASVKRSNKFSAILSESLKTRSPQNRTATQSAEETESLRAKLSETNLYNVKLLFTNKLLQNESLTKRQKAMIIEKLDEVKNEREAKLVYESLTRTLATERPRLTEGRSVAGTSSRPVGSTSPTLNEGFEADRWAKLAGIVKK